MSLEAWALTQALWEPLFTPGCSSASGTNRGLVKLPNCNLYRLTNNFTPDPLDDASDYTISKPADQGSRWTEANLSTLNQVILFLTR